MLCQRCQFRNANVHFTKIVNNKKVEMYLCEQCAQEEGQLNHVSPLNIVNFLSGFVNSDDERARYTPMVKQLVACSRCGMTFEDFRKSGKMGCSQCYKTYKDRLKPILKRLHGDVEHRGKIPSRISETIKDSEEINRLKELLNEAVRREEYEKAAQLRDKIKELETHKNYGR
ncbi:MAG: UvrB/UvrC motif-containing protein [Acetivibrionales bacterium]|jgi:protein arginine kinase activator